MEGSLVLGGYDQKGTAHRAPRRRHLGPLPWQVKPRRGAFHNLQTLFVHRAGGLRGFSLNFLTLKHLLFFLGITQQSTSHWIRWCQRDRIITIQQLALVLLRASAAVGPESREADGCPLFPQKEGQTRAELFHRKKLTVHADFQSWGSCGSNG